MADLFPLTSRRRGGDGKWQSVHMIACGKCGAEDLVSAQNTRMSDGHLTGTFQKRGWRVSPTGKHACPSCLAAETRERRAARQPAPGDTPMKKPPPPPPSPAASSAIVSLYVLLEDAYDRAAKGYRPGWSDERLAKETGLALDVVQRRREADFGPVVVDTTFNDIRAEMALLKGDIAHLREASARLADIAAQLDLRAIAVAQILNAAPGKAPPSHSPSAAVAKAA